MANKQLYAVFDKETKEPIYWDYDQKKVLYAAYKLGRKTVTAGPMDPKEIKNKEPMVIEDGSTPRHPSNYLHEKNERNSVMKKSTIISLTEMKIENVKEDLLLPKTRNPEKEAKELTDDTGVYHYAVDDDLTGKQAIIRTNVKALNEEEWIRKSFYTPDSDVIEPNNFEKNDVYSVRDIDKIAEGDHDSKYDREAFESGYEAFENGQPCPDDESGKQGWLEAKREDIKSSHLNESDEFKEPDPDPKFVEDQKVLLKSILDDNLPTYDDSQTPRENWEAYSYSWPVDPDVMADNMMYGSNFEDDSDLELMQTVVNIEALMADSEFLALSDQIAQKYGYVFLDRAEAWVESDREYWEKEGLSNYNSRTRGEETVYGYKATKDAGGDIWITVDGKKEGPFTSKAGIISFLQSTPKTLSAEEEELRDQFMKDINLDSMTISAINKKQDELVKKFEEGINENMENPTGAVDSAWREVYTGMFKHHYLPLAYDDNAGNVTLFDISDADSLETAEVVGVFDDTSSMNDWIRDNLKDGIEEEYKKVAEAANFNSIGTNDRGVDNRGGDAFGPAPEENQSKIKYDAKGRAIVEGKFKPSDSSFDSHVDLETQDDVEVTVDYEVESDGRLFISSVVEKATGVDLYDILTQNMMDNLLMAAKEDVEGQYYDYGDYQYDQMRDRKMMGEGDDQVEEDLSRGKIFFDSGPDDRRKIVFYHIDTSNSYNDDLYVGDYVITTEQELNKFLPREKYGEYKFEMLAPGGKRWDGEEEYQFTYDELAEDLRKYGSDNNNELDPKNEAYFPGNNIEARAEVDKMRREKSIAANDPIEHHIHNAMTNSFTTNAGKKVKGAILSDIHNHVNEMGGFNISKRKLLDVLNNDRSISQESGHSHAGASGTRRNKATFYTMNESHDQLNENEITNTTIHKTDNKEIIHHNQHYHGKDHPIYIVKHYDEKGGGGYAQTQHRSLSAAAKRAKINLSDIDHPIMERLNEISNNFLNSFPDHNQDANQLNEFDTTSGDGGEDYDWFGPYETADEARHEAIGNISGFVGDEPEENYNYSIKAKADGFYWSEYAPGLTNEGKDYRFDPDADDSDWEKKDKLKNRQQKQKNNRKEVDEGTSELGIKVHNNRAVNEADENLTRCYLLSLTFGVDSVTLNHKGMVDVDSLSSFVNGGLEGAQSFFKQLEIGGIPASHEQYENDEYTLVVADSNLRNSIESLLNIELCQELLAELEISEDAFYGFLIQGKSGDTLDDSTELEENENFIAPEFIADPVNIVPSELAEDPYFVQAMQDAYLARAEELGERVEDMDPSMADIEAVIFNGINGYPYAEKYSLVLNDPIARDSVDSAFGILWDEGKIKSQNH